jgi:kynurenine formamidase
MKYSFILFALLIFNSCQNSEPKSIDPLAILKNGEWIDLTYDFDENTIYWPTNTPFSHDTVFYGFTERGFFYSSGSYAADEHGGTHLDAPIHFSEGKNAVEQIPVNQLTGEGILVDVSEKALKNNDYLVSVEDLEQWEKTNGRIPDQSMILLFTGYGQFWSDREKYIGTSKTGAEAVQDLHFPGLDLDAAQWLVAERKIKGIGLDTPSIDFGQSKDFLAHQILSEKEILIFENVANLDKMPAKGFYLVAMPMKIKGGTGAPLRIAAFIPPSNN